MLTINFFFSRRLGEECDGRNGLASDSPFSAASRTWLGNLVDLGDRGTVEGRSSILSLVTMLREFSESLGGR